MKIVFLKERLPEPRVALTPAVVAKLVKAGHEVGMEQGAGILANFDDAAYKEAGAAVVESVSDCVQEADVMVAIRPPELFRLSLLGPGKTVICKLDAWNSEDYCKKLREKNLNVIALEQVPRISRAQSMDVLSSQANIAGYRAVLEAFAQLPRAVPMMTTAAGSIKAARVLIMGVGVAGLQAIATAKRMGALVSATDVRPDTKEQVESLAAKFVAVEDEEFQRAQTAGGYAKQMSEQYQRKQAELIARTVKSQDVIITTALIPGKAAPQLLTREMVESMPTGAVICDLAAETGGNCELTKIDKVIEHRGVRIIGHSNWPGLVPQSTSELFANNLFNFLQLLNKDGQLHLNLDDEIISSSLYTQAGENHARA